jgi:protein-tyrosine kinase
MARHRDIARIEPGPLGTAYAVLDTVADPPWSPESAVAGAARLLPRSDVQTVIDTPALGVGVTDGESRFDAARRRDHAAAEGTSAVTPAGDDALRGASEHAHEGRPGPGRPSHDVAPDEPSAVAPEGHDMGASAGADPAGRPGLGTAGVAAAFSPGHQAAEDLGPQRRLGEILADRIGLSPRELDEIAQVAGQRRVRYGDAAVALGRASEADVLAALAEQFRYPMAPRDGRGHRHELAMLARPFSRQAEAVRALRNRLGRDGTAGAEALRALAVVSADRGDGKTFLAANLAVALAQRGGRTVLVDADLRGPRQHEVFDLEPGTGLAGMLSGRADPQAIRAVHGVGGLFVLPAGQVPPNPLELVERADFARLIALLKARFDHVIVDTPAARYGADPLAIADRCGAALLLARRHASALAAVQALAGTLAEGPVRVAGLVVNEF